MWSFSLKSRPRIWPTSTTWECGRKSKGSSRNCSNQTKGFILFSATPASGLRSTTNVVLHEMDRFTRDFVSVESEGRPLRRNRERPRHQVRRRHQPGRCAAEGVPRRAERSSLCATWWDGVTVSALCRELADSDRLVIATMRAKDGAEALLRMCWRSVCRRRNLRSKSRPRAEPAIWCASCATSAKKPTRRRPKCSSKLGIPQGRIRAFYRPSAARSRPNQEKADLPAMRRNRLQRRRRPFSNCSSSTRRCVDSWPCRPTLDLVRQAARKAGMKSLQEEGILLVCPRRDFPPRVGPRAERK